MMREEKRGESYEEKRGEERRGQKKEKMEKNRRSGGSQL
jgi:hypothetical protein